MVVVVVIVIVVLLWQGEQPPHPPLPRWCDDDASLPQPTPLYEGGVEAPALSESKVQGTR